MTSPERMTKLGEMRAEFYADSTSLDRRVEIATQVSEWAAEEMPGASSKCINCKKTVIQLDYEFALVEGHIYSSNGVSEFSMSRMCEFCFDKLFLEKEESIGDGAQWALLHPEEVSS